jgi:hypothetical protein
MGLSQLLAVSRSVRTIKDGPARYKMTQQNLLPRFGTEKPAGESDLAPSAAPPLAEPVRPPAPVRAVELAPAPALAPPVAEQEPIVKTEPVSSGSGTGLASDVSAWKAARSARPTRAAAFVAATKKLSPFGSLFRNPFRNLLARENGDAPMQTELLLDSVKPIRNDLREAVAESDLQRVPEPAGEPGTAVAAARVTHRVRLWDRLKKRLVGGGDPG